MSSPTLFYSQFVYIPTDLLRAQVYGLMGDGPLEHAHYDSARAFMESNVAERPDDARYRSALAIAYAGLGRREDAIREAEAAVELLPMSREAWVGAYRLEDLARVYTMVGEYDAAIDQLEVLLSVPSPATIPMLRLDPTWAPLREHPWFRELVEEG
jgi:tetratricopeptide (TPR) repeat protein